MTEVSKKRKAVTRQQPSKNEVLGLMLGLTPAQLSSTINMPMDKLSEFADERNFDEEQLNILRDIRCRFHRVDSRYK